MNLQQMDWKTAGKAVLKEYNKDDVPGLAAELAYHFVFALFPFAIFLAALAGFIGHLIGSDKLFDQIMSTLYSALPPASAEALSKPLTEVLTAQRGGALSIGAILALWSASNGVGTVMKAFNRAYGVVETRSFLVQKALAVGMTVVLSLLLISGFILLAFGGQIGELIASGLGLGALFTTTWNVVRIVGALFGISLALALLYWQGPNVKHQFRWLTPGSVLTTITWAVATAAFGFYVQLLGASSYSKTYGTAFGFILFLLYLYLTSTIIVLGAELNAETAKRLEPELIRDQLADQATTGRAPARHKGHLRLVHRADAPPADSAEVETVGVQAAGHGRDNGGHSGTNRSSGRGGDRTALTTAAISAAAVAGALVLGALTQRGAQKKAA